MKEKIAEAIRAFFELEDTTIYVDPPAINVDGEFSIDELAEAITKALST